MKSTIDAARTGSSKMLDARGRRRKRASARPVKSESGKSATTTYVTRFTLENRKNTTSASSQTSRYRRAYAERSPPLRNESRSTQGRKIAHGSSKSGVTASRAKSEYE